jgi:L-aspartate oxidase
MTGYCGIVRDGNGLLQAQADVDRLTAGLLPPARVLEEMEVFNLLTVASLVIRSALERRESRGVHLRADWPERDDEAWCRHLELRFDPGAGGGTAQVRLLAGSEGS